MAGLLCGLCSVTFRALAPADVVALASRAGLAGIEWGADIHVPPGDTARAQEVRRLTEGAGLAIASYGSYLRPPEHREADFAAVLATAVALGAPNIRVWPGARNRASGTYDAAERADVARLLTGLAAAAAGEGVTVSLEFHPGTLTDEPASAAALIQAIGAPGCFLYWQPRPGIGEAEALQEVAALGGDVSHLHVFAWDKLSARYPLADHDGFWRAILAALPPPRWTGPRYAMLEFVRDDSPAAFMEDAATLRRLVSG